MASNTSTEGIAPLSIADCRAPSVLLATGFGVGFSPVAPGTAGSLLAIPLWWYLLAPATALAQALVLLTVVVAAVGIVERVCRRRRVQDDQAIVLDEIAGMWITLWAAPRSMVIVILALLLFRAFDIWKPWPVSWVERRLPGGLGVVMDDVVAGVLAAAVLNLSVVVARSFGLAAAA